MLLPRSCYILLLLLCCKTLAFSQDKETDSLLAVVKSGTAKEKTDALNALCMNLLYNDPASAKQYIFKAIETADGANYAEGGGKAWNRLGIVYDISGNYDSAIACYHKALDINLKAGLDKGIGSAYNNLGLIYQKRGNLREAISYFYKAMPFFEKINNKEYLGNLHNNISLVYQKTKDYKMAANHGMKALRYYREINDDENIGGTFTNLAIFYEYLHKKDSGFYFINQAILYHTKSNNLYGLSTTYINYGNILDDQGNVPEARKYFEKALALKQQLHDEEGISYVYTNLANNYMNGGDHKNEYRYWLKALDISLEKHFNNKLMVIYKGLAEYHKVVKNSDSVYYYLNLYNAARDSIYTGDFKNSLAEAQTRFETKEKELTIKSQQYQLSLKNYYIAGLIGLILFILLLFYLIYNWYRTKQKNKLQREIILQQDLATRAVIRAEENERRRVASDLHDSVGQMLSAVKLNLSALRPNISEQNARNFDKITDMVDESCKEVRAISHNMMPNSLLKNGLVSAIREFIGQLTPSALIVNLETSGLSERLDDNVETVLYRVVQECVNNVVKHANASRLDIQLIKDSEGISITIEDNGKGFDTAVASDGIGMKNLASRIGFLKGNVDISSSNGKGTLIAIFIPEQNKL